MQTDRGKEFVGGAFQNFLKARNIHFRVARNPVMKAAVVERFNRTLKERKWRYFTYSRNKRYADILQDLVKTYNHTRHSSIGIAPSAVTLVTAAAARSNLMQRYREPQQQHPLKYRAGDIVRISGSKAAFAKGYESGWTSELFKIHRVSQNRWPVVYFLRDLHDEDIDGILYEPELSRVQATLTTLKSYRKKKDR